MSVIAELVRHRVLWQAIVGIIALAITSDPAAAQQQAVSNGAKYLGLAAAAAMVVLLGLAYFFLTYGGDYVTLPESSTESPSNK